MRCCFSSRVSEMSGCLVCRMAGMAPAADRNAALTLDPFHNSATPELAPAFRALVADEESGEQTQAAGSMGKARVHGMWFSHFT